MDQFGSPAQPSSMLGSSMGGQTPRDLGTFGGPGSVMGGPGSMFGLGSMSMSGIGPGSVAAGSVQTGGPGSVQPGSTMFNIERGPMSVAPGGHSTYEPGSVLQLSVPMTPLPNAAGHSVVNEPHGHSQMQVTYNPTTPASQLDIPQPQLQNIVSTVNLGVQLDLKKIALQARNAEFNPKRFAAVIMRIRDPRTTALIFSSGKMVCTGAKSEEASRLAARKYARIVQKLGFPAKFTEFKVQNMVGSCDVKFPIQLEGICLMHNQFSTYEPELFPGLIYRMVKPRVVLLIFVSGKVVITGAKYKKDIDEAFSQIYPILKTYKKQ
ncbi:hypothetical protein QR680_014713 [Steinernema hermaphroditum]|uniref:TATA-box-binding protein n=1 Tax=Steinernema hermaphroditum TaxID=289476 RepID=A0AA39I9X3_9BILA|nr:hypothetical protein QR680_014713 [Steinernema hermaphroditum]